jgi:arylsulfatase A-like enzyme
MALGSSNNSPGAQKYGKKSKKSERPNILWICTDQQRYDTIHALGNKYIRTPNIDKLVETGTAFAHAYCQSPICTPSRASFLTGMYPSTIHACINGNVHHGLLIGAQIDIVPLAEYSILASLTPKPLQETQSIDWSSRSTQG